MKIKEQILQNRPTSVVFIITNDFFLPTYLAVLLLTFSLFFTFFFEKNFEKNPLFEAKLLAISTPIETVLTIPFKLAILWLIASTFC